MTHLLQQLCYRASALHDSWFLAERSPEYRSRGLLRLLYHNIQSRYLGCKLCLPRMYHQPNSQIDVKILLNHKVLKKNAFVVPFLHLDHIILKSGHKRTILDLFPSTFRNLVAGQRNLEVRHLIRCPQNHRSGGAKKPDGPLLNKTSRYSFNSATDVGAVSSHNLWQHPSQAIPLGGGFLLPIHSKIIAKPTLLPSSVSEPLIASSLSLIIAR